MKRSLIIGMVCGALLAGSSACSHDDLYSENATRPEATVDDTNLVIDGKAESARIALKANIWWKARVEYDGGEEWLALNPTEGFGDIEIAIATGRNYQLDEAKTARLIIESDDAEHSYRKEFALRQDPSAPYIEIDGIEEQRLTTAVTRSETALTLYTNDEWEATTGDEEWCTVQSDGNGSGRQTVRLICTSNATRRARSTSVVFRSKRSADIRYRFEVTQSGIFDAPTLRMEQDDEGAIRLEWDAVMGAVKYVIALRDGEVPIAEIDNGPATACDLSATDLFARPQYAGNFSVTVRALSDDPGISSESNAEHGNSHFAAGSGTAADPFVVDRDCFLRNIARVNAIARGCHYRLDYTPQPGSDFEPICSPDEPFTGIFDGNGKVIAGWQASPAADRRNYFGFFGAIGKGAEVRALAFERCSLHIRNEGGAVSKADNGFAWVAAANAGTVRDIRIAECTIDCEAGTSPLYVGGIAARNEGVVADCRTSGSIAAASDRNKTDEFVCGGIAAYNYGTVDGCVNDAAITAMNQVGGIVGMNGGTVLRSVNNATITANYYFGGVVGYTTSSSATCVIESCRNNGTLIMDEPAGMGRGAAYMGGITSRIYSDKTVISKCCNSGELIVGRSVSSSNMRVGGIVGHTNKAGKLTDCYNSGDATIRGKANYGGIVGEMASQATVVSRCHTTGALAVDGGEGNLHLAFGKANGKALVSDCYALDRGGKFAGGDTSGISGGGLLDEKRMRDPASFAGWDFVGTWRAGSAPYPYPVLR